MRYFGSGDDLADVDQSDNGTCCLRVVLIEVELNITFLLDLRYDSVADLHHPTVYGIRVGWDLTVVAIYCLAIATAILDSLYNFGNGPQRVGKLGGKTNTEASAKFLSQLTT